MHANLIKPHGPLLAPLDNLVKSRDKTPRLLGQHVIRKRPAMSLTQAAFCYNSSQRHSISTRNKPVTDIAVESSTTVPGILPIYLKQILDDKPRHKRALIQRRVSNNQQVHEYLKLDQDIIMNPHRRFNFQRNLDNSSPIIEDLMGTPQYSNEVSAD